MNEFFAYWKETENKYRWDTDVDGVRFSMYIPKWRVPEPYPNKIGIRIYLEDEIQFYGNEYVRKDYENDDNLKFQDIIAKVEKKYYCTKTVRFDPVGVPKTWEIGSPYIPIELMPFRDINSLIISVKWMYEDV